MKLTKWVVLGAALLISSPMFATTYMGGFEDFYGSHSDDDYNDMVFSISGTGLTLHSATGQWFAAPALSTLNKSYGAAGIVGTPFWNNPSLDGAGGWSIGSCIYGGGACNSGVAMMPGANYLATSTGGSVNDVYFSVTGNVSEAVTLSITAATDALGWELVSGVGGAHYFANGVQGAVSFDPGGNFVLLGDVTNSGTVYSSNTTAGDGLSHFAFFTPTPEPSTMGLLSLGFIGAGLIYRRKKTAVQ